MAKALFLALIFVTTLYTTMVSANCVYEGKEYSKGATITTSDGESLICECDADGSCEWL